MTSCIDLLIFMLYVFLAGAILYLQMGVGGGSATVYQALMKNLFTVDSNTVEVHDGTVKKMLNSYEQYYDWFEQVRSISCRANTCQPVANHSKSGPERVLIPRWLLTRFSSTLFAVTASVRHLTSSPTTTLPTTPANLSVARQIVAK